MSGAAGRARCGAALLLTLALAGCAANPVTGEPDFVLLTEAEEIALGARYHEEILRQYRVYDEPQLQAYVERIGERLAAGSHRAHLAFRFTLLDSEEINAFALPGGYVYITRGIMAYLNSEAELAGVIGHEIGHVTARHSVRQHSRSAVTGFVGDVLSAATGTGKLFGTLGQALTSGYGREHELEADRLGAQYLALAGYRPENMTGVIGVLKDQEQYEKVLAKREGREPRAYHGVFASHPRNDRRLEETVRAAREFRGADTLPDNQADYLARLDGLVFGPSPEQGVVRGQHFYHAGFGFALSAPDGWRIANFAHYVAFVPAARDAFLQLDVRGVQAEGDPESELLNRLGTDGLEAGRTLAGDFPAYTAVGYAETPFGARTTRFVAWVLDDQVFMLAGAAQDPDRTEHYDRTFLQVAESFRQLSADERRVARALRLTIATAPPGGYAALAKSSPLEDAAAQLRLLNGDYPGGEAAAGRRVKVIR